MKKNTERAKEEASAVLREVFINHALDYVKYIEAKRKLERLFDQLDEPNQEEYEHINWLLKRVKKEIKRKDQNLNLLDWDSRQADRLSGQIEAFEYIEMLINEIGKPSYFRNKHRESELN